ncbi:MAG: rhodanese-like domain-containing protein [Candidatus Melainabacteria bacterium]|nr:rhodanese-like domain-containing protein [Candidatus Melainabacteria bacterium]
MSQAASIQPLRTFKELVSEAKTQIHEITAPTLKAWLSEQMDLILIDVREEEDFQRGSIRGAISIPRGELEMTITDHTDNPQALIVTYCGGGSRSALAALSLQQMGYANVHSLQGGFKGWMDS